MGLHSMPEMALLLATTLCALHVHAESSDVPWVEVLSWKPRASLYHRFMTDAEADHMVALASPLMERSSVVNYDGTVNPADEIRTSWGAWLRPAHDEVIAAIEARMATWVQLPISHSESLQVLRYEHGQTYRGHWDELDPTDDPHTVSEGSPRVATVLMYLSDVEEGGETAFPNSFWLDEEYGKQASQGHSECTEGGVATRPKKGDALLFFGLKVDVAHLDRYSFHTGCPVIKGVKWSATAWIHTLPFRTETAPLTPPGQAEPCVDRSASCRAWVRRGECTKNSVYMVGEGGVGGNCRKACGVCCPPGDLLCERSLKAGSIWMKRVDTSKKG